MPAFTKGQWTCESEESKYIFGREGEVIGELFFITREETEANARLIAATPEMYKGLRECLDFIENIICRNCNCSLQLDAEGLRETLEELLARIDGKETPHE